MAKVRAADLASAPLHRTLTPPGVFLLRMGIFLVLVAFLAAILSPTLKVAFITNPGLNGLIVAVFFTGVVYAFRQVIRLYPEIRWVNGFRIADPGLASGHKPLLLSPMAALLRDRRGVISLSTGSLRSIMDSIGSRLDEARDTGRYIVGLLVFLGLLGTFWGLLETIQSVGKAIGSLDTKQTDNVVMLDELKRGLQEPLKGMGTAFSASLLGLAGSLVIGFLELQASHAHNRFYNELEEWLSGITDIAPAGSSEATSRLLQAALVDVQRSIADLSEQVQASAEQAAQSKTHTSGAAEVAELAKGVDELVRQMRAEQKVVREWVDEQASQQGEVAAVLKNLASSITAKKG